MPDNPTNADIIASVAQLHDCVEGFGAKAEENHTALTERVDDLADTIGAVGGVADAAKTAAEAATAAAIAASAASKETHDMVTAKFDGLNSLAWKVVGTMAAAIFVSFLGIVAAIILNGLSIKSDQVAARQATAVAAAAPAEDAHDADRDARLLAAIAALKASK